jgi:hypothetical protein
VHARNVLRSGSNFEPLLFLHKVHAKHRPFQTTTAVLIFSLSEYTSNNVQSSFEQILCVRAAPVLRYSLSGTKYCTSFPFSPRPPRGRGGMGKGTNTPSPRLNKYNSPPASARERRCNVIDEVIEHLRSHATDKDMGELKKWRLQPYLRCWLNTALGAVRSSRKARFLPNKTIKT